MRKINVYYSRYHFPALAEDNVLFLLILVLHVTVEACMFFVIPQNMLKMMVMAIIFAGKSIQISC